MINSSERTLFPSFFCSRSVFRVNLDGEGKMNLSELIEGFREIDLYDADPQDWMNYLESDDCYVPDQELVY